MAKVSSLSIPPAWEPLIEAIFRWYEINGLPIFASQWLQGSRYMKYLKQQSSKISDVAQAWNNLSDITKAGWDSVAVIATTFARGYRMYTSDFIWRQKVGLPAPEGAVATHQLFGIKMSNLGGAFDVHIRRDDKDLVGQITFKFSYKKDEITPSVSKSFNVNITAYYFGQGTILTDTDSFTAPAGDVAWTTITRTFGTVARKYFHIKIVLTIKDYDAIIYLDNLILSDSIGEVHRENFNTENYAPWIPNNLYRKRDWLFNPGFYEPYFIHEYLQ